MKKIITILILTSLSHCLKAQEIMSSTFSSKEMLQKGKQEQKNSMILMGLGVVSYTTALVLDTDNKSTNNKRNNFISVLKIAGVSMSAVSIPMFFSSKSKVSTSRLMLGIEKLDVPVLENGEKLISLGIVKTIR